MYVRYTSLGIYLYVYVCVYAYVYMCIYPRKYFDSWFRGQIKFQIIISSNALLMHVYL
jgi:hypothetical protein